MHSPTELDVSHRIPTEKLNFSKHLYLPRVVGLGLGSLCIAASLHEQTAASYLWVMLFLVAFIWPHIAYYRVQRNANPKATELNNFLIDCAFAAFWLPIMQFNLLPSAIIISMLFFNNLASGGSQSFIKGLLAISVSIMTSGSIFGFQFSLMPSEIQIYACLPMLMAYPLLLGYLTYSLLTRLSEQNKQLRHLNVTDGLTQTYNRRYWESLVQITFLRANRTSLNASILMIAVDDLKVINDQYGHLVGDEILQIVARTLKVKLRSGDAIGRYSGEKLGILLTDSNQENALKLADKFCTAIEKIDLAELCDHKLSINVGVASLNKNMTEYSQWVNTADSAMRQTKSNGKSQCVNANT